MPQRELWIHLQWMKVCHTKIVWKLASLCRKKWWVWVRAQHFDVGDCTYMCTSRYTVMSTVWRTTYHTWLIFLGILFYGYELTPNYVTGSAAREQSQVVLYLILLIDKFVASNCVGQKRMSVKERMHVCTSWHTYAWALPQDLHDLHYPWRSCHQHCVCWEHGILDVEM